MAGRSAEPRPGCVDEPIGLDDGALLRVDRNPAGVLGYLQPDRVLDEPNPGAADSPNCGGGQLARVDGLFCEPENRSVIQVLERRGRLVRDGQAGERGNAIEEAVVERDAEVGEFAKLRRIVGVFGGQHSCSSRGGAAGRGSGIEKGDRRAPFVQFKGQGKANDACTSDDNIRGQDRFHVLV